MERRTPRQARDAALPAAGAVPLPPAAAYFPGISIQQY